MRVNACQCVSMRPELFALINLKNYRLVTLGIHTEALAASIPAALLGSASM